MKQPNLLPESIKVKALERRRLVLWLKGVAVIAVFGVVGCVVAGAYLGDLDSPVREEKPLRPPHGRVSKRSRTSSAWWKTSRASRTGVSCWKSLPRA